MQYELIKSYTEKAFIAMINSRLKDGWECQGGVQVLNVRVGMYDQQFFQAMVKKG